MSSNEEFIIRGEPDYDIPEYPSFPHYLHESLLAGGDAVAQIANATDEKVTYAQIRERSIKLSIALQKLGVKKGDVVSISSENRFEFTVSAIAIISIGALCSPMNILYSRHELIHAMKISKPKFIFCSPITFYNILDVMQDIPSLRNIICYGDAKPEPSVLLYNDLLNQAADISKFECVKVDVYKDPFVIFYSSGTTGLAKAVMLSHYNFILVSHHMRKLLTEMSKEDCLLSIMPWFHAYGFTAHITSLINHLRYVFMVKFEEEPYLKAIQKYKITVTMLVPPLMLFLAKHPLVEKYDLSTIREIWCGAAPLSKEIQIAVQKRIGAKYIKQGYGLTETTLAVLHSSDSAEAYGSCGKIVNGTQVKVVDLTSGKSLGPNKNGELCFKGPLMMLGYLGDAASTEKIFDSEGWLHSGDVGYYDENGYFYIVDRIKELIKYNAFQVPPAELEAILLESPAVKDAGVVGLPDSKAGELPTAFVVLQPGAKVTAKELVDFVAKRVSPPKRLRGGVHFIDEIPKNPSGKILRRELKEMLLKMQKSKL